MLVRRLLDGESVQEPDPMPMELVVRDSSGRLGQPPRIHLL
jgi:hypothetical protein